VTNGSSGAPPFVVRHLSAALEWVEKCCLLQLLRRKGWLGLGDCCTDLYVIGQFGLAAVAYVLSFWVSWTYVVNLALGALVIFYSGWRIIELVAFFFDADDWRQARGGFSRAVIRIGAIKLF
jgi:hypothetical protein